MPGYKAGIDYSMSCPSICVSKTGRWEDSKVFFLTSNKKMYGCFDKNLYGMEYKGYNNNYERFDAISDWGLTILKKFGVDEVCLEGYAFAGKGQVFNIAENTGLLKHKMWKEGIKIYTPSPPEVKKFYANKGNAKKDQMYEAFYRETSVDLVKILGVNADKNPTSDVVDSFAMMKFGFTHYFS